VQTRYHYVLVSKQSDRDGRSHPADQGDWPFAIKPRVPRFSAVSDPGCRSTHYITVPAIVRKNRYQFGYRDGSSMSNPFVELVDRYLTKSDWLVTENANRSFSLPALHQYLAGEVSKRYWLDKVYPPAIAEAHARGDLHLHDLGYLSVYCVGWDLEALLAGGIQGLAGKIGAAPPRHLRSALGQVANFFYTMQQEAAGALAFANFDTLLAPFIRQGRLGYDEIRQCLQEFLFNMNTPTRAGFQSPFTNITLDGRVPDYYAAQPAIVAGERQAYAYGECQGEMDLFNRALLEMLLAGDAQGRPFTFPIPTYNVTPEFPWESPALEGLWELAGKYGLPYFANFVNSDMRPEEVRSMCCRLRIDTRQLQRRAGGFFASAPQTGSIGVVTLNLPRLAHLGGTEQGFFDGLEHLMALARDSLEIKRETIEGFMEQDLYPYSKHYLRSVKERFGSWWENHFSTIGLIGMNEACLQLVGEDIGSGAGQALAVRTLNFMRERLTAFQQASGHLYNLEATPAEGCNYRLAKLDKEHYPAIPCANEARYREGHAPFYTNSTHLPVDYSDDPFEVLEKQDPLQTLYTGGTVLHLFVGERIEDWRGVRSLVRTICSRYRLPYFTITPTFSVCPACGYLGGEHECCPRCGGECEVYSRVVGYLRPVRQWNLGKQEEFHRRTPYRL